MNARVGGVKDCHCRLQTLRLAQYQTFLLLAKKTVTECTILTWSKDTVIHTSSFLFKRVTGIRARGQLIAEAGMISGG